MKNNALVLAAAAAALAACSKTAVFSAPDLDDAAVAISAALTDISIRVPAYGIVLKNGEVEVSIEASDSKLVHSGQDAAVAATPDRPMIACRVSRVLPSASAETGQSLAWLKPLRAGAAAANNFVTATITVAKKRVLAIPKSAVLIRDGGTFAVRLGAGADGKTAPIPVAIITGEESGELIEVRSGLKSGERVVVQGAIGSLSPDFKSAAKD